MENNEKTGFHASAGASNMYECAWYLEQRGAKLNWKSAEYTSGGMLRVVYLQDEIGGFAVHLVQK